MQIKYFVTVWLEINYILHKSKTQDFHLPRHQSTLSFIFLTKESLQQHLLVIKKSLHSELNSTVSCMNIRPHIILINICDKTLNIITPNFF